MCIFCQVKQNHKNLNVKIATDKNVSVIFFASPFIFAQGKKNSILLTEVLFHSRGRGSISEGAKPSYLTDSRSSILGLSNEVSFDFELYWKG